MTFTRIQKVASKAAKKEKKKVCRICISTWSKLPSCLQFREFEKILTRAILENVGAKELNEDTLDLLLILTEMKCSIYINFVLEVKFKHFQDKSGKKLELATVIAPYEATSKEQLTLAKGQMIIIK